MHTHHDVIVRPPSAQAYNHDATYPGSATPPHSTVSAIGVGAHGAEQEEMRVAGEYQVPKTCADGLWCNARPTLAESATGNALLWG